MAGARSSRFNITHTHAALMLGCSALLAACAQAPQAPAPVFALPLSRVVGAPAVEGQEPPPSAVQPGARQLRYVAVPPGHKVAGMAHAHLILKQAVATPHRAPHAHKTKIVARRDGVGTAAASKRQAKVTATPQPGDAPAAMIMLDEPAPTETAKPASNP